MCTCIRPTRVVLVKPIGVAKMMLMFAAYREMRLNRFTKNELPSKPKPSHFHFLSKLPSGSFLFYPT